MKKIVLPQKMNMFPDQIKRIKKLGDVTLYDDFAKDPKEWFKRCKNADIICTSKFGLQDKIYNLKNVFISLPFVGVGWIDLEKLKGKNITISCCPGCNKEAVSEWIIGMMLSLGRKFPELLNTKKNQKKFLDQSVRLS